MLLRKWEDLPDNMRNEDVRYYYDILSHKKGSLILKRIFDLFAAVILFIFLLPLFLIISVSILQDSKGGVFFRQTRITSYGKEFSIFKFRTMVANAENIGSQITVINDMRITKVGRYLRKFKLDEIPQLFNIITGDMTFVGTRPEVVKYVEIYTHEMLATLLLPAGVTSETSIHYKDEEQLIFGTDNIDNTYFEKILPDKMVYNLKYIEKFNFFKDLKIMIWTVIAVFIKDKKESEISK